MCTERLRKRVPSANPIITAKLQNHSLRFHKRSDDRSGKCDACFTGEAADIVWGVIFDIDAAEKPAEESPSATVQARRYPSEYAMTNPLMNASRSFTFPALRVAG
jgi:hypothetical protein